jgi:hypothetical protein
MQHSAHFSDITKKKQDKAIARQWSKSCEQLYTMLWCVYERLVVDGKLMRVRLNDIPNAYFVFVPVTLVAAHLP